MQPQLTTSKYRFKAHKYHRPGFTLTEVVVASAILAFALVPILKGLSSANAASVFIERKTKSLFLAQAKMENLRALSIYNFDSLTSKSPQSLSEEYLCSINITEESQNLKKVTVSIGYDSNSDLTLQREEVSVTLQSFLARRL